MVTQKQYESCAIAKMTMQRALYKQARKKIILGIMFSHRKFWLPNYNYKKAIFLFLTVTFAFDSSLSPCSSRSRWMAFGLQRVKVLG